MSDIGDWFRSIPLITRTWFAASIAVPLIGKLGLVNPKNLMLWPELFFNKFHVSLNGSDRLSVLEEVIKRQCSNHKRVG